MRNIKLIIEYDGIEFCGWQKQPEQRTVQGEIEKALRKITREDINIIGSGRTDSGVHATGQVANFFTNSNIPVHKFALALNSVLSKDVTIKESYEADEEFHSRYSAKGKEYKYLIYNQRVRSPLLRHYTYHVPYELDLVKINRAGEDFIGEHDFRSFMASGRDVDNTVRRIDKLSINRDNNIIEIVVRGNGFLYNMVRIMVGTLIDIGIGKISQDNIPNILLSKNRQNAGHTAKPQGLYLEKVFY